MAKDPDDLAGSLATENTGGLLSGFLAEEDELDRRALWRLGSWGVAAVGAVIVAVMANQSQLSWRRDQVAAADLVRQAQQIQAVARDSQGEARRLASAIDTLSSDRDRLYSRVSSIEQGLESVTGAIARQNTPAPPRPAEPPAPPAPAALPAIGPVASTAPPAVAPEPEKPALAEKSAVPPKPPAPEKPATADKPPSEKPASPDKPAMAEKPAAEKLPLMASIAPTAAAAPAPGKDPGKDLGKSADAAPLVASRSLMAPPDPAAGKLIEPPKETAKEAAKEVAREVAKPASPVTESPLPEIVAATPPAEEVAAEESEPAKAAIQKTEFGVDVGSANSIPGLRALWRGLLKSRSNASLAGLRPIIVIREANNGLGMQLRLVAGPLSDAGAAARICAGMLENQRPCETAIFDGQRLSLKPEDAVAPPSAKPAARRHTSPAKRPAAAVVEEPKKPEPTTMSTLFGRKNTQ